MGKKGGKGKKVIVTKGAVELPKKRIKPDTAANYLRSLGFIIPKDRLS